jgi:hypothetical protein
MPGILPRGLHVFAHLFLLVMPDIGFIVTLFWQVEKLKLKKATTAKLSDGSHL